MYITEKYWNNYIGDTDDSMALVEHLEEKQKKELSFAELFADFGLDQLHGEFRETEIPLTYENADGWETDIKYAIDFLTDIAALLLECKVNGSVDLQELSGEESDGTQVVHITATRKEHEMLNQILKDFAMNPLAYDLSEMEPEENMMEMAGICEELRKELYGDDF